MNRRFPGTPAGNSAATRPTPNNSRKLTIRGRPQNRAWLYIAGILALGVAAASGGLAAAATVRAGTLGLLAISGGFAAGTFAVLNNNALAVSDTVAANSIDQALKNARTQLVFDAVAGNNIYTSASCAVALQTLVASVSDARTHLEVARTDNAAGAIARAKDQLKLLNEQVTVVESTDITHVTLAAAIVDVTPLRPTSAQALQATSVTITVKNIDLRQVGLDGVKVAFGTKELAADAISRPDVANDPTTYAISFTAPANPPDATQKMYRPALIVQGKTRVPGKEGKEFVYP